jgi:hypothetical protein
MPYVVREEGGGAGTVYKKTNGHKKVGHSKNVKKYAGTLRAIEHGFVPSRRSK